MLEKIYFHFLILCAIFSLRVFGTFIEDDIWKSSKLVREKRVISRTPDEDVAVDIGDVPYLVNIRKNRHQYCVGSILSQRTVITAARCVTFELIYYDVLSGSTLGSKGLFHNITHKEMHGHNPSRSSIFLTGIALVTVNPSFRFRNTVYNINLHAEPVLPGVRGKISGWGNSIYGGPVESKCARKLRSITVPIISHEECRNIYRDHFPITDEDFCTYHAQKLCAFTDIGAPFVINNQLVGVHIGGIETAGMELPMKPDVFVLLQHSEYSQWIKRNIVN